MPSNEYDVAVVGGGIGGMCTAALAESEGFSTVVLEQHHQVGGCAGFYHRNGFTFDVGATTLVDFHPEGIGGQLLDRLGFDPPPIDVQDAYQVWLPDRTVTLYHDQHRWRNELRRTFGDDETHRRFYAFLERTAAALWEVTRSDVRLPMQNVRDVLRNAKTVGLGDIRLVRYLRWTMKDALVHFDVFDDVALRTMIAMLVEDTVHSTLAEAPLLNAILGISIRRAGIGRATGGMYGFWKTFEHQYADMGGTVETSETVREITGSKGAFRLATDRGQYRSDQVVSAVPIDLTKRIAPAVIGDRLDDETERLREHTGGAAVVFLGVPEERVADRKVTHHQVLRGYDDPLGDGNNMFVSVSAPEDTISAPAGHRAVILSTHCDLSPWQDLDEAMYRRKKNAIGNRLVDGARTVYPELGTDPLVYEVGTPKTYEEFTNRPNGAVGGYRQTVGNANQNAVPQDIGIDGFYLAGDTTWPGLGTVACVKGSSIAAEHVVRTG